MNFASSGESEEIERGSAEEGGENGEEKTETQSEEIEEGTVRSTDQVGFRNTCYWNLHVFFDKQESRVWQR